MNELSIIIPCLEGVSVLPGFMDELAGFMMSNPTDTDIIIVANESKGSVTSSAEKIKSKYPWMKFEILLRRGRERSFGALARFGVAYSSSRFVLFLSPYGEDDLAIIGKMLQKARSGCQLVQATRYGKTEKENEVRAGYKLYQVIYRKMVRLMLGFDVSDSTYGYKLFDRIFVQALGLSQNGWSLCSEIQMKTLLAGGKVAFIPCRYRPEKKNKTFKLFKEGWGYMYLLLRGTAHRLGVLWF